MLILTRRLGERVIIGDEISVTIMEIRGSQVKLGIEAPREVSIHREEVYRLIKAQNEEAVGINMDPSSLWRRIGEKEGRRNK